MQKEHQVLNGLNPILIPFLGCHWKLVPSSVEIFWSYTYFLQDAEPAAWETIPLPRPGSWGSDFFWWGRHGTLWPVTKAARTLQGCPGTPSSGFRTASIHIHQIDIAW
jgi:hypothetical protein